MKIIAIPMATLAILIMSPVQADQEERRLQLQESERRLNNARSRAQRLAREFDSLKSGEYQRRWDRMDNSCDAAASARFPYHIWSQEAERYTIRTHNYRRILSNLFDTAR